MKALKVLPIALLLTASMALAQTNTNQKPASTAPAAQQQTKPDFTPGAAATAPTPKHGPQAKTKPEYDAYVALMSLKDPAAMEKATEDFITKYPDSELKGAAYERVMLMYQQAGNDDKTIEMGHKSLTFNPDSPGVLVALSDTLVRGTHETDLDKDQRLDEATKYARHALETVGDYPAPANMPPDQVVAVKNDLRSAAYTSIGAAAYTNKKYADAETSFKQAIEVTKTNPDPTTMLRLALTLDKLNKYPEALDQVNQILAMQDLDPRVSSFAQQEKERLSKLVPAAQKPAAPPAPPTTAPNVPK